MEAQDVLRRAFDLSLAIYRVTALFPHGEILGKQMRELGNEIAGDSAAGNWARMLKKIEKILIFFEIAREQKWVKAINWTALGYEYGMLRVDVGIMKEKEGKAVLQEKQELKEETAKREVIVSHNIQQKPKRKRPNRTSQKGVYQEQILTELRAKEALKMSDLIPLFKYQVSDRTLRTALQELVNQGLVKKSGSNKSTVYSIA